MLKSTERRRLYVKGVGGYIIKTRRLYVKKTEAMICFILFLHQFSDRS